MSATARLPGTVTMLRSLLADAKSLRSYCQGTYKLQIRREYLQARIALECYRVNQKMGEWAGCVEAAELARRHRANARTLRLIAKGQL